jgi:hypothetical protein
MAGGFRSRCADLLGRDLLKMAFLVLLKFFNKIEIRGEKLLQ